MEKSRVIRSAGVVGAFTMLSRSLGLVRDVVMAGLFGTSLPMSAFVVAWTVPNLFRRLFGEGALSAAFIPVFVETKGQEGTDVAWRLARRVITLVGSFLVVLVVVGLLMATLALAGGDMSDKATLTLSLLRILLPYMFFICLVALAMAILNSFHHFALPAATPCFLNVVWIVTALYVASKSSMSVVDQIHAVSWGILAAGALQLAIQLPVLSKYGYKPGLSFDFSDPRVKRVLLLMGPAALGLAVTQVNVMIDRLLAIWVGPWAPAALFYSERLIYFPLGILATAFSTVLLPVLSGHAADEGNRKMLSTINHSFRNLMYLMIPASVGLLVLAEPIVQMIFEWRQFDATSTAYTTIALQFYAPGLIVFSLVKIMVPAFYAQQDTRTPVKIGLIAVVLNLALNLLFVFTWPPHMKHAGLACATVLAELFQGVVLARILQKRIGSPGWVAVSKSALRALVSAVIMAVVVYWVVGVTRAVLVEHGVVAKMAQIGSVLGAVVAGICVYITTSFILRSRELTDVTDALRKRK